MPESSRNGKALGGGVKRRVQEASTQIVQIEGGSQLLELLDKLGSMDKVIQKLTTTIEKVEPKSARGQRSLPGLCRALTDIFFKCQAVNMKLAREQQVEEVPMNPLNLHDQDILEIAQVIKARQMADALEAE